VSASNAKEFSACPLLIMCTTTYYTVRALVSLTKSWCRAPSQGRAIFHQFAAPLHCDTCRRRHRLRISHTKHNCTIIKKPGCCRHRGGRAARPTGATLSALYKRCRLRNDARVAHLKIYCSFCFPCKCFPVKLLKKCTVEKIYKIVLKVIRLQFITTICKRNIS
jgi:hypothetical protein